MDDDQRRWVAGFRVFADLILPADTPALTYRQPEGEVEIEIRNAEKDEFDSASLTVYVTLPAADREGARTRSADILHSFLYLLTFVTAMKFRLARRLFVLDWSPGVTDLREGLVWARSLEPPQHDAMSAEFIESVALFESASGSTTSQRALRWFSLGVRASIMEDQFQYFWFVIELVANAKKVAEKVADRCATCRGDLYCPTCEGPSMHRPYSVQKIRMIMKSAGATDDVIERASLVRNMIMHGDDREHIEEELTKVDSEVGLKEVVNVLGRLAREVILRTFTFPPGTATPVTILDVSTYVEHSLEVIADIALGLMPGADAMNPKIDDIALPKFTIEHSFAPAASGQS